MAVNQKKWHQRDPYKNQKGNGYQSGPLVESSGLTLFSTIPPVKDRTIAFSLVSFLCSLPSSLYGADHFLNWLPFL